MIKRPAITALLITSTLAVGFAIVLLSTTRNVDEKPFIIYFVLVAFPFGWFLVWIFLAAIAWWQGLFEVEVQEQGARKVKPNGTDSAT